MKFFNLLFLSLFLFSFNSKPVDFILENELRFKEYSYYQHTDLTVEYKLDKHFIAFVGGRFLTDFYEDKLNKEDFWYNRFHTGFHYELKQKWGKIAFRSRFEYTPGEEVWTSLGRDIDDDFRFRERLKYNLPYEFTKFKISPFVFGEIFIDIDGPEGLYRTRIGGGVDSRITKHLTCALYYFLENKESKNWWHDENVLAMTLKYKF